MNNNKICWVTATYFLDVDLPIVPKLMANLKIDWYIITNESNRKSDERYIKSQTNCQFTLLTSKGRFYSPYLYKFYKGLIKFLKSKEYDMYYFDISDYFFLFRIIYKSLPINRVVIALHNVSTPKGARLACLAKISVAYILKRFTNFHVFSKNQESVLRSKNSEANIFYSPLMLKDYGNRDRHTDSSKKRFLFFGNILKYKRVDILLNAVKLMESKGIDNFVVRICGNCGKDEWEKRYQPLISSSKIECDIRRIPNEEVSKYFNDSDFFVMPYQDIAQSGAMTVAFNYNIPIIASDLDTFMEFLNDGVDGFFFKSGDSEDLARIMELAVNISKDDYDILKNNQRMMIERTLSANIIINNYREFINSLLNANVSN